MNDAVCVRESDRVADLREKTKGFTDAQRPLQAVVEPLAAHQFQRVVGPSVRKHSGIIDRHDTRMLEACERRCLARQALAAVRRERGFPQHLQSDLAIKPRVPDAVHRSHAAAPQLREELVARASQGRCVA